MHSIRLSNGVGALPLYIGPVSLDHECVTKREHGRITGWGRNIIAIINLHCVEVVGTKCAIRNRKSSIRNNRRRTGHIRNAK